MRFNILGPLEVVADDGAVLDLGPTKRRAVLALLLCRVGICVPVAELVDALWGAAPPPSAGANLRSYIHRLRGLLGADLIVGRGRPGYTLAVGAERLDVTTVVELARRAETATAAGDPATARNLLRSALARWRGDAFADLLTDVPALAVESGRLDERRLTVLEACLDAELDCGRADHVVGELAELAERYPYRERFCGQLMLALYRSGRQVEALDAYRRTRALLRRDLAVDPDRRLVDLEQAILRHDPVLLETLHPSAAARPAELPARPSPFTGRDTEMARLDELTTGGSGTVLLTGAAGVGKTALAVHWGHRHADRFADGQIFLDLRGFSARPPATPAESLGRLLRALGAAPEQVPEHDDEASALYRSLLADRRLLVVLDNAGSVDQIRPLLPGAGGCVVLVTSRRRMPGLVVDGVGSIPVDPLSGECAADLLARLLAADRVAAEPAAVPGLAEVCGRLPLALRIAAAELAERPDRTIADMVADLRHGRRLDALQVDGDEHLAVRAAFDLSYRALDPDTRRTFRLLGMVPGPTVTAPAVAALTGAPELEAAGALHRLREAHLLDRVAPHRYALHDLIREYAAERAETDGAGERSAATNRLLTHYVDTASAAALVAYPQLVHLPGPAPAELPEPAAAEAFLSAEAPNLVAAALAAAPGPAVWRIADALRGTFWHHRDTDDWRLVAEAGARAAAAAEDHSAVAGMALSLAHRALVRRDYREAVTRHVAAARSCRRAGWREGEASVLNTTAAVFGEQGDLVRSIRYSEEALAVGAAIGWLPAQAVALANRGLSLTQLGRLAEAQDSLERALPVYQEIGSAAGPALVLSNLVDVYLSAGLVEPARRAAEQAHEIAQTLDRLDVEVHVLLQLSAVRRMAGDPAGALRLASAGRELVGPGGDRLLGSMAHEATGLAYDRLGRSAEAEEHHLTALELSRRIRSRYAEAVALVGLSGCRHAVGAPRAGVVARTAVRLARRGGFRVVEGQALLLLAGIAARRRHRAAEAARLAEVAEIRQATGWQPEEWVDSGEPSPPPDRNSQQPLGGHRAEQP